MDQELDPYKEELVDKTILGLVTGHRHQNLIIIKILFLLKLLITQIPSLYLRVRNNPDVTNLYYRVIHIAARNIKL
jgi:hypothetical protein